ncbi:hypothetical protein BDR26DRAFT_871747 [Obelidium mucronatum]|nr:hypothetical protein BDR26DRAFT_871747 [Obelidium mucronatum]
MPIAADCSTLFDSFPQLFPSGSDCCRSSYVKCTTDAQAVQRVSTLNMRNAGIPSSRIPNALCGLTGLQILNLAGNSFTGIIPGCISQMTALNSVDLSVNQLTAPIDAVGSMPNLQFIRLSNNSISGSISNSLSGLAGIQHLDLKANRFTGSIPSFLSNLTHLSYLDLSSNQLTGSIPSAIMAITSIQQLILSYNQLSGSIPDAFEKIPNLISIHLESNQLTGKIPTTINKALNLYDVDLSNNLLNGTIPQAIGQISALSHLDLSGNRLTGLIPSNICKIYGLQTISLANNYFTGPIPAGFNAIANLQSLDVSGNCMDRNRGLWMSPNFKFGSQRDLSTTPECSCPTGKLYDENNCGLCKVSCAPLGTVFSCIGGMCDCPTGTLNDVTNCGACGIQCGLSSWCANGVCSCSGANSTAAMCPEGYVCYGKVCKPGPKNNAAATTNGAAGAGKYDGTVMALFLALTVCCLLL